MAACCTYHRHKNVEEFSEKKFRGTDQQAEKKIRENNRTTKKNKRRDSKAESNDSPEIPDRGETSDIPGLPSGRERESTSKERGKKKAQSNIKCTQTYLVVHT